MQLQILWVSTWVSGLGLALSLTFEKLVCVCVCVCIFPLYFAAVALGVGGDVPPRAGGGAGWLLAADVASNMRLSTESLDETKVSERRGKRETRSSCKESI